MSQLNFDVNRLKEIAYEIFELEFGNSGIDLNFFPITFLEYYSDYVSDKKSIDKMFFGFIPVFHRGGFRVNETRDIVVFLHPTNNANLISKKIFNLVKNCYHEIRHFHQENLDAYSYEGFLVEMENYISGCGLDIRYALHHDKYFVELDANLYGISKTKEYMMNYYPFF